MSEKTIRSGKIWRWDGETWSEADDFVTGATTLFQLSDPHLGQEGRGQEVFRRWCDFVAELRPDVVAVTGDVSHIPEDESVWDFAAEQLDRSGVPWCAIPGNHDIGAPFPEESKFDERFGPTPRVEEVGELSLVLFDSFRPLRVEERREADVERGRTGTFTHGAVGDDQLREAAVLVAPLTGHRVALVHHHLHPHRHERGREVPTPVDVEQMAPLYDVDVFLGWCAENAIELILTGHQHAWAPPEAFDGIPNVRGTRCTREPGVAREIAFDPAGDIFVRDWHP